MTVQEFKIEIKDYINTFPFIKNYFDVKFTGKFIVLDIKKENFDYLDESKFQQHNFIICRISKEYFFDSPRADNRMIDEVIEKGKQDSYKKYIKETLEKKIILGYKFVSFLDVLYDYDLVETKEEKEIYQDIKTKFFYKKPSINPFSKLAIRSPFIPFINPFSQQSTNFFSLESYYDTFQQQINKTSEFDTNFYKYKSKDILVTNIEINNFYNYGEFSYEPTPNINIILGKNGFMKTEFLRMIASFMFPINLLNEDFIKESHKNNSTEIKIEAITADDIHIIKRYGKNSEYNVIESPDPVIPISLLVIPDNRFFSKKIAPIRKVEKFNIMTSTILSFVSDDDKFNTEDSMNYLLNQVSEELKEHILLIASKDVKKGEIPAWTSPDINKIYISEFRESDNYVNSLSHLIEKVLNGLINEKSILDKLSKTDKDKEDIFFKFHSFSFDKPSDNFILYVITEGSHNSPIPIQRISRGTFSILFIFGLIYCYLQAKYPKKSKYIYKDDPLNKQPAIVFIDEIDAHLHPSYQKEIIRLLRENFPRVQFFIVAHNPLSVMGCYENEIAVMKKEENKFVLKQYEKDTLTDSSADILLELFDSDDIDNIFIEKLSKGIKNI